MLSKVANLCTCVKRMKRKIFLNLIFSLKVGNTCPHQELHKISACLANFALIKCALPFRIVVPVDDNAKTFFPLFHFKPSMINFSMQKTSKLIR